MTPTTSPAREGDAATARHLKLALPRTRGDVSLEAALQRRRSVREFSGRSLALGEVAQLLWAAQGENRRSGYRTAPSAGALFPLEIYLAAGRVASLDPGAYRYDPATHALASVRAGDLRGELARAALGQAWLADAPATLVIAAVAERTTAHYGSRGRRYVHMEAGHAGQNVCLQAAALGLGATMVGAFDDEAVEAVLDMKREAVPLGLLPVGRPARREAVEPAVEQP